MKITLEDLRLEEAVSSLTAIIETNTTHQVIEQTVRFALLLGFTVGRLRR